jgi:hypothetical protein
MSTLRYELHKNEFLMDKVTKQLYFVVSIDLHNVVIREEVDGDDAPLKRMPKHLVNASMIKVNVDAVKILFGDKKGEIAKDKLEGIN